MDRKILRSSVAALVVAAVLAVPMAASAAPASAASAAVAPRAAWGVEGLWDLVVHFFTGTTVAGKGLTHVSGANRGTIDPNGDPLANTTSSVNDGDNRGTIDPNG